MPTAVLDAARLKPPVLVAVREMARAVAEFCAPQRPPDTAVEAVDGVRAERRWLPLESVGIYVPGGRAAYPSSLVMAAVPARVPAWALAVVTPRPAEATLAVARELGIDEVYAVGGAQAVAALAYGTETIPQVDKIVGPGNQWVTAAKLLVSSRVAIDLPAGPSEVVVIADATADAAQCAADLLAQAEHGPDSRAMLLSLSPELSALVAGLVGGSGNVSVEDVASLDEALARSEAYAPEHLELWLDDADAAAERVRNAGTIFVGTSAVVGDYAAGATHVLPTGGLARGPAVSVSSRFSSRSRSSARRPTACAAPARSPSRSPAPRACRCTPRRWRRGERPHAAAGVRGVRVVAELGRGGRAPRAPAGTGAPIRPEHAPGAGGAARAAGRELCPP